MKTYQNALKLLYLLAMTNAVGFIGASFMSADSLNWYETLVKSALTPPDFVFGVVWTTLYFMMGFAAFLVWGKVSPRYFVLQLAMNLIWPFAFFFLRATLSSCFIILFMLYFLYKTIKDFGRVSKAADYLMMPTFLWALFALYLNVFIVVNN